MNSFIGSQEVLKKLMEMELQIERLENELKQKIEKKIDKEAEKISRTMAEHTEDLKRFQAQLIKWQHESNREKKAASY